MRVRTVYAAAALAAAVAVYGLVRVRRDRGRLQGQVAAQRLMAGCTERDNAVLHAQLEEFRRRLGEAVVQDHVVVAAGTALDRTCSARTSQIDPHTEGGL